MTLNKPISIRVSCQRAFVFDVDDVARLRADYRLTGVLGGTLPHLAQQNVFLGLPVILLPEEVVLLVTKGFAVLVDDPRAYRVPSQQELTEWDDQRIADALQQLARAQALEDSKKVRVQSEEAIQKRKEREERRKREALEEQAAVRDENITRADAPTSVPDSDLPAPAAAQCAVAAARSSPVLSSSVPFSVSVPSSSDALPWYRPELHTFNSLDDAREAGAWTYPALDSERAKCEIFRDLWEKGYFMGGGSKFGGDWLVYPGDPLRYHSHFVATVHSPPESPLRPMEIVAHGRLGTATKKAHLLCSWDPKAAKSSYLSIEWAGFG